MPKTVAACEHHGYQTRHLHSTTCITQSYYRMYHIHMSRGAPYGDISAPSPFENLSPRFDPGLKKSLRLEKMLVPPPLAKSIQI
jgi:hypothetical protein